MSISKKGTSKAVLRVAVALLAAPSGRVWRKALLRGLFTGLIALGADAASIQVIVGAQHPGGFHDAEAEDINAWGFASESGAFAQPGTPPGDFGLFTTDHTYGAARGRSLDANLGARAQSRFGQGIGVANLFDQIQFNSYPGPCVPGPEGGVVCPPFKIDLMLDISAPLNATTEVHASSSVILGILLSDGTYSEQWTIGVSKTSLGSNYSFTPPNGPG